jgi:tRNA threonylcarbamoyladenosine biosynthesis protein TsaE
VAAEARTIAQTLSHAALETYGEALGRALRAPALVTLRGDLGAGKTTLSQAICRGLGVTDAVTSPTFALVHEYAAPSARVVHCDLYRLGAPRDVEALGVDELLADPRVIMLVEWPERAGALLSEPTVDITLAHVHGDADVRAVTERWHP